MSSDPDEDSRDSHSIQVGGLAEADRALLLAMRAWAVPGESPVAKGDETAGAPDFIRRFANWLDPSLVHRLCEAWDRESRSADAPLPAPAIDRLKSMHHASARFDLARVHPSWVVRALVDESPAVQRVVVASLRESVRHRVQAELLLDSQDLIRERAVAPAILGWVQSLWSERLVGGEPERPDDPPVIMAMTRLSLRAGYSLCRMTGLGKMALAGQTPGDKRSGPLCRARLEWLTGRLATAESDFQAAARQDVQAVVALSVPNRHQAARIGLMTFARLLSECEPFRLRWALQHWPYPIAKLTRSLIPPHDRQSSFASVGELLVLKTAWDRLTLEERLSMPWPDPGRAEKGAV